MPQTKEGAAKVRAARLGMTVEQYQTKVRSGLKHCQLCKTWHPVEEFSRDASRPDGLNPRCRVSQNDRDRNRYTPKSKPPSGRRYVAARNGDKKQARRRVNHLVDVGVIPNPNTVPCVDCHQLRPDGRRHEYDHYLGYAPEHHESVEAVCSDCHHRREIDRRVGAGK